MVLSLIRSGDWLWQEQSTLALSEINLSPPPLAAPKLRFYWCLHESRASRFPIWQNSAQSQRENGRQWQGCWWGNYCLASSWKRNSCIHQASDPKKIVPPDSKSTSDVKMEDVTAEQPLGAENTETVSGPSDPGSTAPESSTRNDLVIPPSAHRGRANPNSPESFSPPSASGAGSHQSPRM